MNSLFLNNNRKIGDEGCAFLMSAMLENSCLENLDLRNCGISNGGAVAIAGILGLSNCPLKRLHIGSNWISADGFVALADALPLNLSLQSLDLSRNVLSERCWSALDLALRRNHVLRDLGSLMDYCADGDFKRSIQRNLALNKMGPLKAEVIKTGISPRQLLLFLSDDSIPIPCFLEALAKAVSFQRVGFVFTMIRERPTILLFSSK